MRIRLHPGQSEVFRDIFIDRKHRYGTVRASRGFGKSYLGGACAYKGVLELLALDASVPNKNVYVICPTYSQATDIYYPILEYQLGAGAHALSTSRADGIFKYPKDVVLRLVSYEAIERIRGTGAYLVIGDEVTSWKKKLTAKKAWEGVIQPCITTRWSPEAAARFNAVSPGRAIFISTPMGYDFFYDAEQYSTTDPDWGAWHFDYTQSPFLDVNEINKIRNQIDPIQFAREYKATFEDSGNNVFYMFNRKIHVSPDVPEFIPPDFSKSPSDPDYWGEDVHVSIDFNVGIMAATAWGIRGQQAHAIWDTKGAPNTEALAELLKAKFKGHRVFCYPDPTGNSRKTSAAVGLTDIKILKSAGFTVLTRSKSPPIVDSVKAVNARLMNTNGEVNVYLRPECKGTIESLERTKWLENDPTLAVIDKSEGQEHFSDGARYFFEYRWKITAGTKVAARGFGF